jgi:hypothetical protein
MLKQQCKKEEAAINTFTAAATYTYSIKIAAIHYNPLIADFQ